MESSTGWGGAGYRASDTAALLTRARSGDGRAQRALYESEVDRVYRVAYRLAGDEERARDYTQQAFVRAFHGLDRFRGDASFRTWVHRIVVNVALAELRRERRAREGRQKLEIAVPTAAAALPSGRDPLLRRRIRDALASLPASYREAVVLHDIQGYTHDEIGRMADISPGTSKARLSRARARLRSLLAGCGAEYWASVVPDAAA